MARHAKLMKKISQLVRDIKGKARGDYDRVDLREETMSASSGVLALIRGQQRRADKDFGIDTIATEAFIAVELLGTTFDRHDFSGGGDNGVRMVLATGLVEALGLQAGDKVQIREGEYEGRTITIDSVDDTLDEVRFADDAGKGSESNISATARLSSNV